MQSLLRRGVPIRIGIASGSFEAVRFRSDITSGGGDHAAHFPGTGVAPHEFKVCASEDALLERIDPPGPIKLDEISSGQRAAFALSLFLALNSRATRGPPIMLIDDPVAHVDDLNTLSFLDYLRDLAATGERQIFFATADEKLAALFTHKFSFLGEQNFKSYELARE